MESDKNLSDINLNTRTRTDNNKLTLEIYIVHTEIPIVNIDFRDAPTSDIELR